MKITKLHIENFGKLSNYNIDFNDGITTIYEENGFGKTTLAAFIMSMFYGFDKKKSEFADNKRDVYEPWQGGLYGGSLCFECERGKYRIERFFSSTKKKNTFKLYNTDNGQESFDFTENIGGELFGMDIDAFIKSIYIPQKDLSDGMPTSIMARLNNSSIDEKDISSFDRAVKALEGERKKYRLERGQGGECWVAENAISKTEREIEAIKDNLEQLPLLQTRIIKIDDELQILRNDETKQNDYIKELATKAGKYEADLSKYADYKDKKSELDGIDKLIKEGYNFFKNAPQPTDEQITQAFSDYTTYTNIRDEKEDELSPEEIQTLSQFKNTFENGVPSETEISIVRNTFNNNNAAINEQQKTQNRLDGIKLEKEIKKQNQKKKNPILGLVLACVSFVFVILAVVYTLYFKNMFLVGASLAVIFAFLFYKGIRYYIDVKKQQSNEKSIDIQTEQERELSENLITYKNAINDNSGKIQSFRDKFGITDIDFLTGLSQFEKQIMKYNSLVEKEKEMLEKQKQHQIKIDKSKEKILSFVSRYYDIKSDIQIKVSLDALKSHCNNLIQNQNKYDEKQKELSDFIQKNSIDINSQPQEVDYKALQELADKDMKNIREEIQVLTTEKNNKKNKIEELMKEQQELISLQEQKAKYKEELEIFEYRYKIINQTIEKLKKAKENLSLRYLEPIKKGFEKYSSMLTKSGLNEIIINSDFEVKPIELGQQREAKRFSKGYRSIIDICLRFSMIEALFDKEKPLVILDDPFVNLDDDKLVLAKELLIDISKEIQIIYFVCHESRKIQDK